MVNSPSPMYRSGLRSSLPDSQFTGRRPAWPPSLSRMITRRVRLGYWLRERADLLDRATAIAIVVMAVGLALVLVFALRYYEAHLVPPTTGE